jgi:ADP-ribosylglycohydrolase
MTIRQSHKHFTGCLLGGAIGDALGAPIEFMSLERIRQIHGTEGVTGYCEFRNEQGEFTDDTQMTLFTAEGLLRANHRAILKGIGGATLPITFQSYQRWLFTQGLKANSIPDGWGVHDLENGWLIREKGLFKQRAPGNSCISSLRSGIPGTIEEPVNNSKGCGAIMRMAPVGLIYGDTTQVFKTACDLGALTHGHSSGYLSAGVFATIIQLIGSGLDLEDSILRAMKLLQKWSGGEEVLNAINQTLGLYSQTKSSSEINSRELSGMISQLGEGWVGEEALAISLFCCLHNPHNFRKGVLASVNHSGDSDSTGSITGNILGLMNNIDSIPEEWIINLRSASIIRQVGEDLWTGCESDTEKMNDLWWNKYPGY